MVVAFLGDEPDPSTTLRMTVTVYKKALIGQNDKGADTDFVTLPPTCTARNYELYKINELREIRNSFIAK